MPGDTATLLACHAVYSRSNLHPRPRVGGLLLYMCLVNELIRANGAIRIREKRGRFDILILLSLPSDPIVPLDYLNIRQRRKMRLNRPPCLIPSRFVDCAILESRT